MDNQLEDSTGMQSVGHFSKVEYTRLILGQISPLERSCLLLSIEAGFTLEEIAEILNTNQKEVKDILNRGYEQFLQIYYSNYALEGQEVRVAEQFSFYLVDKCIFSLPAIELSPETLPNRQQRQKDLELSSQIHDYNDENSLIDLASSEFPLNEHQAQDTHSLIPQTIAQDPTQVHNKASWSGLKDRLKISLKTFQRSKSQPNTEFKSHEESRKSNFEAYKDDFRIGKYRLLELLSEGRHTDVWLAERIDMKKKVAIKILFPQEFRAGDARMFAKKLFFNEAQNLAQFTHPHIVQVFDYVEEEEHGWSYFVMEYAPFGSLADRYAPGERLPLSTVEAYTSQIGRAIHHIHTQGLIHRDIKPQNMFLKTRNSVVLGDFGLVTRNHGKRYPWMKTEFGGTRIYMAPEQERGEPCPASDQYAYATVVFEWLTGYWPFYGDARELAWQRRHLSPPLMRTLVPEIPAAVEWVVLTALHKSPSRRFRTMLDFTLEFEEACKDIKESVPFEMLSSYLSRTTVTNRHEATPEHAAMLCQQKPGGAIPQLEFTEQGDVLVASPPVLASSWLSDQDFGDLMFGSGEEEMNIERASRLQNLRSRINNVRERVRIFFRRSR
jgi:serine/threonine protein kinase